MRFYDDIGYYHFSTQPTTDAQEKREIFDEKIEYGKDFFRTAFKPEKTVFGNIVKYLALGVFALAVLLMVLFSIYKIVAGILYTFGGLFIIFGIMMLIPTKVEQIDLPGQAKLPKPIGCGLFFLLGLSVIVPAAIAPTQGYTKATVGGIATAFLLSGLFIIVYTLYGVIRQSRAMKEKVTGKCIGYIKMVDGSNNSHNDYFHLVVTATPVFEYFYKGRTYKAFQESAIKTGAPTIAVGETVDLGVLPEDPYAVYYRKTSFATVFAIVLALLAVAAGVFLFWMMPNVNDENGFVVNTMGGEARLAKAQFDDALIESYVETSDFTIEYVTVTSVYNVEGTQWAMDLSNGTKRAIVEEDKDKYYEGCGIYLVIPGEGSAGLSFIADDWEYTGTKEVINMPSN